MPLLHELDLATVRVDFPMLATTMHGQPLVYFDNAATALTPQSVIDTIATYYTKEYGTVHRAVYELATHATERCHQVRKKVAHFLGVESEEEIIFTKGTTESLNLVASCLGRSTLSMLDEVVIAESEHHANIVPWQLICQERGAKLRVIPVDDCGDLVLDELKNVLTSRTKIISISHISNSLGTVHPIKKIAEWGHDVGAIVVVDGAQAAPHCPLDMASLGADFYAFSGHKLFGPTGIGVLWGRRDLLEELPPYQGGGDMIEKVTFQETTFNAIPFRFEAGTPNIAGILGLGAAIEYVEKIGLDAIAQHEERLHSYATEKLEQIEGLHILGKAKEKGPIISFQIEGIHPLDIGTLLDLKGIAIRTGHLCAQPTMARYGVQAVCRVSFAFYNTIEEVDQFIEALHSAIQSLRI